MSYSKRQIIQQACEIAGLASYDFDLTPDQLESAKKKLDSMIASWDGRGIRLGFPVPSEPEGGSIDDDSGIPDIASEAVIYNLAIRIGGAIGRQMPPETRAIAKTSLDNLIARSVIPEERRFPDGWPVGAGYKGDPSSYTVFSPTPENPVAVDRNGEFEFS